MRTAKLGDICEFKPSKRLARIGLSEDDPVSFVPMNDLGIHQKYLTARDERPLSEVAGSYTYFAEGDVLLAKITPCFENGKLGIARGLTNGVGFGSSEFIVIRPGAEVLPEYVYYFLDRDDVRERGEKVMTGAVGHKRVPQEFVEALEIPLPPLEEQRRIVAVLDEAFAAIATATANAEKNLANACEMRALVHRRAFSELGERKPLGQLASFRNGVNFTSASRGEEVRIAGVKDFQNNLFVPDEGLATIRVDGVLADDDLLQAGDILTVRSNGNKALIGRCMIAANVEERTTHSGFTIRVRADTGRIDAGYLCRYLKSPEARERLVAAGAGANISSLSQKVLASLPIPVPPIAEQQHLVQTLDELDQWTARLEALSHAKLLELSTLKQSVLHRALSGGLIKRPCAVPSNDNFSTPEFAAHILAVSYERHVAAGRAANFGHVKAQKTLHAVEAIAGLDLGRQPIKDAAGPNDFAHMRRAEAWARDRGFFEFVQRTNGGYDFRQLGNYHKLLSEANRRLEGADQAKRAIEALVDMDSDWAEIVVTTHAAWNNLILDQATITDEAIVQAARDDWHPAKLRYDKSRFHDALRFIRANGIVPNGSMKRVVGQERLPL